MASHHRIKLKILQWHINSYIASLGSLFNSSHESLSSSLMDHFLRFARVFQIGGVLHLLFSLLRKTFHRYSHRSLPYILHISAQMATPQRPYQFHLLSDLPRSIFLEQLLLPEMIFHFNFLIVSCLKWFTVVSLLSKTGHGIWQCKIQTSFLENSSMIKLISLFIIGKITDTLRLRIVKSLCQDQIISQWYC